MDTDADWLQVTRTGVLVHVHVTPNGSRSLIEAPIARSDGQMRLRVKVRAQAADNAANIAVCTLLAKWADVPKSVVSIARGHTNRQKTVAIEGMAQDLCVRLRSLAQALDTQPFTTR